MSPLCNSSQSLFCLHLSFRPQSLAVSRDGSMVALGVNTQAAARISSELLLLTSTGALANTFDCSSVGAAALFSPLLSLCVCVLCIAVQRLCWVTADKTHTCRERVGLYSGHRTRSACQDGRVLVSPAGFDECLHCGARCQGVQHLAATAACGRLSGEYLFLALFYLALHFLA